MSRYWMYALDDEDNLISYKGDSGLLSEAITPSAEVIPNSQPTVGCAMRVGSIYARTYPSQDWWMTTPVTEIVEDWYDEDGNYNVIFHTRNSRYHWKEI